MITKQDLQDVVAQVNGILKNLENILKHLENRITELEKAQEAPKRETLKRNGRD